ncbi:hypothetical protein [Mesorhizobium ventifaucium]|uniref:Uncharacterized protein n=1 Tax=Mesorhizobium ventifaucium TaxID=666020 RepID=A0ABM9DUV6_9HYPH|nr:hypothetical protein [Mesorhizobium ventifaucium]CAH2400509.1 hypothetical protein MES4922_250008 [Mesorhizobium ventifaucium]
MLINRLLAGFRSKWVIFTILCPAEKTVSRQKKRSPERVSHEGLIAHFQIAFAAPEICNTCLPRPTPHPYKGGGEAVHLPQLPHLAALVGEAVRQTWWTSCP